MTRTTRSPLLSIGEDPRRHRGLQRLAQPTPPGTPRGLRRLMAGQQTFLASVTVSELRYGALVAGWGHVRRRRLEGSIRSATVVPVTDALLTSAAELRLACRRVGHPLHDPAHTSDLWIATSAIHIDAPLLTADSVLEATPGLVLLQ